MACKVRTVKMDAVYSLIKNLMADPTNGVNTTEEAIAWIKKKYGDKITEEDIIDAFVVTSVNNVDEVKKELNQKIAAMRAWARNANKLGNLLNNTLERHSTTKPEPTPEIKQMQDVFERFNELAKSTSITDDDVDMLTDMVRAIPFTSDHDRTTIQSVLNHLKGIRETEQKKRNQERVKRMSEQLGKLLKGEVKRVKKTKVPDESHLQELRAVLTELRRTAAADQDLTPVQIADIKSRLQEIEQQYLGFYDTDGEVSEESLRAAIDNYRRIREEARVDGLRTRVAEARRKVDALNDPDSPEYNSILVDNTRVPWKSKDREVLELEMELSDAQEKFLAKKESILRKARATSITRIAGYEKIWGIDVQGKGVQGMINFYYAAKQHGWELWRTLKFMLDNGAFFVQLSGITMMDIFGTPLDLVKWAINHDNDPFAGIHRISKVWMEGFFRVVVDDWNSSDKHPLRSKKSKGVYARSLYNQLLDDDLYDLMIAAGLKLSRSRSLTGSEDYFKTNIINKFPGLGFLKDVSEDVMVSTLNMYRAMMFRKYVEMHPDLTLDEYSKAAEGINNLTGTTGKHGQILGPLANFLSAPRLLYAKFMVAFVHVFAPLRLDVKKTIQSGKPMYADAYRAFMARQIAGMWGAYGFAFLLAGLAGLTPGLDWEDKDFLRIRFQNRSYDITGGIGAMYRTLILGGLLTFGVPKDASYSTKARITYLKNVQKMDLLASLLGFERTRLHPGVSGVGGIITGRDFMGEPFAQTELGSRAEALLRSMLPIFGETTWDAVIAEKENPEEWITGFVDMILQFHGVNVFENPDKSKDIRVQEMVNKLNYMPDPRYPKLLNERGGKKTADGLTKDYLKNKYKVMWGNALAKLMLENQDMDESKLKSAADSLRGQVEREYMDKYEEDVKKLELAE